MSDEELKQKMTKFGEQTLREVKVGGLKVTLEMMGRQTHLPVAKNARILSREAFRKKVQNARLWKPADRMMGNEFIDWFLRDILRKQVLADSKAQLSAAREKQLLLFPGYVSLPTKIRSGKGFQQFPQVLVAPFLDFEAKYQERAQRDQQRADELHRLAQTLMPYKETELTVAEAFEQAQSKPSTLVLVEKKA